MIMMEAGKKSAQVKATATYTFEEHLEGKQKSIQSLIHTVRECILGLDWAGEASTLKRSFVKCEQLA